MLAHDPQKRRSHLHCVGLCGIEIIFSDVTVRCKLQDLSLVATVIG